MRYGLMRFEDDVSHGFPVGSWTTQMGATMSRSRSILAAAAVMLLGAACGREPAAEVGPVPRVELDAVDPEVARVIRECVDEAERNPEDAGARARLGLAYEVNGMSRAALSAFGQAVTLEPEEPRWSYHRARMQAANGDLAGALSSVDVVLQLDAEYAPAHLRRGDWFLDAGRADDAEESYGTAIRLEPESVAGRIGLARAHIQRGEDPAAIEILEDLLTTVGDQPYVYHLLGIALRRVGDLDLAREAYVRAVNPTKPEWPDPWTEERDRYRVGFGVELARAIQLAAGDDVEQGIRILEELRPGHDDNVGLLSNLGAAYCKTGQLEKGIEVLEAALRHRHGHFVSLANLIQAYEGTGRPGEALGLAERAVEAHPQLGHAHVMKGQVLARLERREEALESFQTARRLDARSTTSLFWSGALRSELNRWSEAVRDFEAVLQEDPRMIGTYVWLARAQAEAGDLAGARESLRQASRATPGAPELDQIRRRIQELERSQGSRR